MSIKFLVLGGGVFGFFFWGGGKCRFYFYGREDFSEFAHQSENDLQLIRNMLEQPVWLWTTTLVCRTQQEAAAQNSQNIATSAPRERKISPTFSCIKFFWGPLGSWTSAPSGQGCPRKKLDFPTDVCGTSHQKLVWAAFPFLSAHTPKLPRFPSSQNLFRCFFCPTFHANLWSHLLRQFQWFSPEFLSTFNPLDRFSVSFSQFQSVWLGQKCRNSLTTGRWENNM